MLKGFSVENFKSFNKNQSISWVPSKYSRHKSHIYEKSGNKVLKGGLIFGANAGGKSNLIQAIEFAKNIVLNGTDFVDCEKSYFKICAENIDKPGVFQFDIVINNDDYNYGFAINYKNKTIVSEWLTKTFGSGKEIYLFNRDINEFGESTVEYNARTQSNDEKNRLNIYYEDFGKNISPSLKKKTILNDIALRYSNDEGIIKEIYDVYKWFEDLVIIFPFTQYNGIIEDTEQDDTRNFLSKMLNYFDTGIESINNEKVDFEKVLSSIPQEIREEMKITISNDIRDGKVGNLSNGKQFYKICLDESGATEAKEMISVHGDSDVKFEYGEESDGTQRLFDLIPILYKSNQYRVIIIDEIDRSLHTNAVRKFIELFYSGTEGSEKQLIATTHDSNLLDLDLLRQDEIWFVRRTLDCSSEIYSLNKYKERFDKKINKEYLLGRYGAIPIFKDWVIFHD